VATPTAIEGAIAKMRSPFEMAIICIDITNKCDLACSNCTRLLENQDELWEMTPDNFRTALRSLKDYPGIIAMIGGNPAMHRHYEELCQIFAQEVPNRSQRGLWTNNLFRHEKISKQVFGVFNLNPHGEERGIKSLKELTLLTDQKVWYHEQNSDHSPLLTAAKDFFDKDEMWIRISECDINQQWSATIIQNKGNLRAYFCEVAASFDLARGEDHGIELFPGWWRKNIHEFRDQIERFCPGCGVPARLKGHMDYEQVDTYSPSNADIALKSLQKNRKIVELEQDHVVFQDHAVTDYSEKLRRSVPEKDETETAPATLNATRRFPGLPNVEIYPKPIYFYQNKAYKSIHYVPVNANFDLSKIKLVGVDDRQKARILSQLDIVKFSYLGCLFGEYAIMTGALLAIDRNGVPIRLNSCPDDDWIHPSNFQQTQDYCGTEQFISERDAILARWNELPVHREHYVMAESHSVNNYYHFHLCFLPKIRKTPDSDQTNISIPKEYLKRPFQRELLMRVGGSRLFYPVDHAVRVIDPLLVQEPFSKEGMEWLRETTKLRASKGNRRIYITRKSTMVGRRHGTILETEEFLRFLEINQFETIDFGTGDVSIEEQILRIDGAGIILSAHGANLTNTVYLDSGVAVIELLPYYWTLTSYMEIAAVTSLQYYGIICCIDECGRIVTNVEMLARTLEQALFETEGQITACAA
jgi:capsular polysaccharide biosynthesis protein/organic radical activating enzyme